MRTADGQLVPDAVVALVPDAPLRNAGLLYRSGTTDINGKYQLRGVAPGSYKIFAWTELEGAAYRNAEFMQRFDTTGTSVRIDKAGLVSADVTVSSRNTTTP